MWSCWDLGDVCYHSRTQLSLTNTYASEDCIHGQAPGLRFLMHQREVGRTNEAVPVESSAWCWPHSDRCILAIISPESQLWTFCLQWPQHFPQVCILLTIIICAEGGKECKLTVQMGARSAGGAWGRLQLATPAPALALHVNNKDRQHSSSSFHKCCTKWKKRILGYWGQCLIIVIY